jgi:hypothetical protein
MGCGASKDAQAQNVTVWKQNDPEYQQRLQKRRTGSVVRMSERTHDAVRDMFSEYRRHSMAESCIGEDDEADDGGGEEKQPRRRYMTKAGLRKILKEVDEEIFEYLWRLFDVDGTGTVDGDGFVMAMGLLAQSGDSVSDQIDATFAMFDMNGNGRLEPDEFANMVRSTVNLSLGQLLDTDAGRREFEAQCVPRHPSIPSTPLS